MKDLEQLPTEIEDGSPVLRTVPGDPAAGADREPFRGGLPLGPTLGVIISVLVAALLGGLIAVQLGREERRERTAREALLAESLTPLAAEIEQTSGPEEAEQLLRSSVSAEIGGGHPTFNLVLTGNDGRIVGSASGSAGGWAPRGALHARVKVQSDWLGPGGGTLAVWQGSPEFTTEMAARRHAAWLDIGVTVLAVILVVQLTIYLLVTRPLGHLLTAIEKVEQGYPARLRTGDVARELRWLAWRFHLMSTNLANSARLLVAAHRRATEASKSRTKVEFDPRLFDPLDLDQSGNSAAHDIMQQYLRGRCARLESFEKDDPKAREFAVQMWEQDAVEAEKCGDMELRARIESAALSILDPDAFVRVSRDLEMLIASRADWFTATERVIEAAFERETLPVIAVQHRTKHAAGAWRKMQERGLALEDVSDLMAFRVIVPTRDDCYLALDLVHRLFDPEPFRFKDYIAVPKANGYQSLHTSVRDRDGFVFEIQIRSKDMHRAATAGAAAHWRYRASKRIRA
jgi:hypothetical protein